MNRRKFLKLSGVSFGAAGMNLASSHFWRKLVFANTMKNKKKNWIWIQPDLGKSEDDWKRTFEKWRAAGIHAILPNFYDSRFAYYSSQILPVREDWLEQIAPLARQAGLEVHAWIWAMPCNIPEIHEQHPEWFVVNRNGESSVEKPAYVPHYKFLCPNREGARDFLKSIVEELAGLDALDGVHLDYIRYPDVILPIGLQPNYNIVQDREYPQYDYCYCEVCRNKFKAKSGIDPQDIKEPSEKETWLQFRYDSISNVVNEHVLPAVKKHNKTLTAAVFPNWENVRQEWRRWKIDAFMPMLYHIFYEKGIDWIGEQMAAGRAMISEDRKIYSGLFLPALGAEKFKPTVEIADKNGAAGLALFSAGSLKDYHLEALKI